MSRGAPQLGQLGVMFGNNTDRLSGDRLERLKKTSRERSSWKGGTRVKDVRLESLAFDHYLDEARARRRGPWHGPESNITNIYVT